MVLLAFHLPAGHTKVATLKKLLNKHDRSFPIPKNRLKVNSKMTQISYVYSSRLIIRQISSR